MSLTKTSRFIAFILRHKPESIGITLDEHGWARVSELIDGISKTHPISFEMLEEIVATDDKGRYSFNEDKTLIRANQGHSVQVDVGLKKISPPSVLYHGTGEKYISSIEEIGLIPKTRLYVHLSSDYDTAVKVGSRHGSPVVYTVDTESMLEDGYTFYVSENGVFLVDAVPSKYIKRMSN